MDRPSGPLGAATQSSRPMGDNGSSRPAPLNTARRIPNGVRHAASSSSLVSNSAMVPREIPISAGQFVTLAKEAMKNALEENQTKAAEASAVSTELKPGVTIDLSHRRIEQFPDEVVDIIKNELERLALSHNLISTFPSRFAECKLLRYLNVRNNQIREFPQSICQLTSLEILDLGRNKLKVLPPELVKLTSLKVLSVQKNRIEDLPLCLADMASLQVLKLDGNPVRFPPKEVMQPQANSPPNGGQPDDGMDDMAVTSQIKRFLRQKAIMDRSETESGGEESSEGAETPRPIERKRVTSGRFPIKVNGTDIPDLRSPALPRPPPIPSRSHYRGLSQQNAALRRPGVMPLTIGSVNERVRSNSESLLQARERPGDRQGRRMGIVNKKSELASVDETKSNRYTHYRGLSHGSAIQASNGTDGTISSRSPASPADSTIPRATYVRRLSSLPERKRESHSPDPVVEAATGILYALFQIHPLIQNLLGVTRDNLNKRTSLERIFYNANTHVEELDRHIQNYRTYTEDDEDEEAARSNENVHRACMISVEAYMHVCKQLQDNVGTLMENGDPRYIRSLLLLMWGSLAEIHNSGAALIAAAATSRTVSMIAEESNVAIESAVNRKRDKSLTPTRERPGPSLRLRSATVVQNSSNLRVATDTQAPPFTNGSSRSNTMTTATPRSGESFGSVSSGRVGGDFTEGDRIFEEIFLKLRQSTDEALYNLPQVLQHFVSAAKISSQQNLDQPKHFWQALIQKCDIARQTADALKSRLLLIKLKEPGIRTQNQFWELCIAFISAFTDLAMNVKEAKSVTTLLPMEVIALLRPLQKNVKETSQLIHASPWSFLATPQVNGGVYTTRTPASQVPLPMTPQSAALGPAVQATVPSTPQSASYNAMFSGDVFQRADALLSMNNASMSRNGTMTSMLGPNDGSMTPSSIMSPMNSFGARYNGNGKVNF